MLRQLNNLFHYGRIRTSAPTPRKRKPKLLRRFPEWEIDNLLELAAPALGGTNSEFFFVQIGAFDGHAGDPLCRLIRQRHWRGVLVEPQPAAFERLKQFYSQENQLQFFNVAVGPQNGELTLYTRKSGDVSIASTARHLLVKPGHGAGDVVAITVPCWTLERLLREAEAPKQIDLLQIDTEGFDYQIIRSLDFNTCRPSILRYEHTLLSEHDRNDCLQLLADQGYRFLLEDMDTTAIQPPENRRRQAA